jgi:hypothetical protein
VVGDALRVVAGAGGDDLLRAPRSLKLPVICRFSSLRKMFWPVMRESISEWVQGER